MSKMVINEESNEEYIEICKGKHNQLPVFRFLESRSKNVAATDTSNENSGENLVTVNISDSDKIREIGFKDIIIFEKHENIESKHDTKTGFDSPVASKVFKEKNKKISQQKKKRFKKKWYMILSNYRKGLESKE